MMDWLMGTERACLPFLRSGCRSCTSFFPLVPSFYVVEGDLLIVVDV